MLRQLLRMIPQSPVTIPGALFGPDDLQTLVEHSFSIAKRIAPYSPELKSAITDSLQQRWEFTSVGELLTTFPSQKLLDALKATQNGCEELRKQSPEANLRLAGMESEIKALVERWEALIACDPKLEEQAIEVQLKFKGPKQHIDELKQEIEITIERATIRALAKSGARIGLTEGGRGLMVLDRQNPQVLANLHNTGDSLLSILKEAGANLASTEEVNQFSHEMRRQIDPTGLTSELIEDGDGIEFFDDLDDDDLDDDDLDEFEDKVEEREGEV